ncbi:MAG TPA: HAD-IB family hydrolase [Amycolatopsis sp.]|uniref:HAD-IB family hydrolase n=1 Tax=Amycolatopsis sp. TaxID=37632 RepID=UPI002B49DC89|nr:HAD-IB family hydrolase [Amycolatopsis sp.]HKS50148.1 HAD-IB family hydrolase [Amycolatopsis sp.]
MASRPSRAAFFDLDGSLITVTSIFRFLAFDMAERGLPEEAYSGAMAELLARKAAGAAREETNRAFYRTFTGRPIADLMAAGERWFEAERASGGLFRPEVVAALRGHRAAGDLTVLVSGSFPPCVTPIARFLGLDIAMCTGVVLRDGRCTGEVVEPMVGEAKARAARELAAARGLRLAECAAYGDDLSDLPLLELVGNPVVAGDAAAFHELGASRGWRRLASPRNRVLDQAPRGTEVTGTEMKVVQTTQIGGPEVLVPAKVPRPVPLSNEVLVQVRAAGVNPVDWKIRSGAFPDGGLGAVPFVQGWDVAGVVESGPRVTRFSPGDEVYGLIRFPRQGGGYGEYVTAPARQLARKPARLTFAEAAALPLAGLTAWQMLVDIADVQSGQKVLVTAAAGGVGHLAAQIAKARGAVVTGTARAAKHEFLASVGVDHPVDYTEVDVAKEVGGQDVVLDVLGGPHTVPLLDTLRPGGLLITAIGPLRDELVEAARERGLRVRPFIVEPDQVGLAGLTGLVESGLLRVHLEQVFPLSDAAKAHELGESGRTTGKIVLSVAGEQEV